MAATMGVCLVIPAPKLHRDDVTGRAMTSTGTDAGRLSSRHQQSIGSISAASCHLHRDSFRGMTMTGSAVCCTGIISERQPNDIIPCCCIQSMMGLQDLLDSVESVITTNPLGDDSTSNSSCNDLNDTPKDDTNRLHPSPPMARALSFQDMSQRGQKKGTQASTNEAAMSADTMRINGAPRGLADIKQSRHRGGPGRGGGEHVKSGTGCSGASVSRWWKSERELQELTNAVCKDGRTLLHNAAQEGDVKMVTRLIQYGAKVNARDANKRTPLHEVANMGHVTVGRLLLENGAKVNARDKWKCTSLHQAIAWKKAKMVYLLLQYNARPMGGTVLQDVINMDSHDDIIAQLIARGADVNATDMTGQTPMHIAVKYGRAKIISLLLEAGANLNKVSRGMMDRNHSAVLQNAQRQLVPLGLSGLLQDGWSPLRMAQKYKRFDMVITLLKCGANIVVCDSAGSFPHHKATMQRNCPSLHHIVAEPNCPIDIQDISGKTAVRLNFEVHAKRMVDANPQCDCCSNQAGPEPSYDDYTNTTILLLQHGADITDLYVHGYDLLAHLCSSEFNYDLCLLQGVLNSGNDLRELLSEAQSCLNALKRQMRLDMFEYLEYFVHSPRTLQDQCRLAIRSSLRRFRPGRSIWKGITSLPLPHSLMDFLLLQSLQGATLTRYFSPNNML